MRVLGSGSLVLASAYVVGVIAVSTPLACTTDAVDETLEEEAAPTFWTRSPFPGSGHRWPNHHHHRAPRGGSCKTTKQDGVTTTTLATGTLDHTRLVTVITYDPAEARSTVDAVVRRRGVDVIRSHATGTEGSMQVDVAYALPIRGIRESTATSDGTTIEGTIDGRAIVAQPVDADPNQTRFVDSGPAPPVFMPFGLQHTIRRLTDQAEELAEDCTFEQLPPAAQVAAATVGNPPEQFREDLLQFDLSPRPGEPTPGAADAVAQTFNDLCVRCRRSCMGQSALEALACLFPPFVAVCEAAVIVRAVGCQRDCSDVGGQCCPIDCGGSGQGEGCCATGTACLNPTNQTCCFSWEIPCGGKECCFGTQECVDGALGPQCCEPCGTECCNTSDDFFCKDGVQCCKSGQECGTTCCAWDPVTDTPTTTCRAPGLCCGIFTDACNGTCCDLGQVCNNGQCDAPPAEACLSPELVCTTVGDCIAKLGDLDGLVCSQGCCYKTLVK